MSYLVANIPPVEVFIDNVEVVADDVIVVEVVIVEVAAEGTSNFLSCCCR